MYQYGPLLSLARKKIAYRWIDFLRSTGEVESEVGVYTNSRRPLESRPYRSQEHVLSKNTNELKIRPFDEHSLMRRKAFCDNK